MLLELLTQEQTRLLTWGLAVRGLGLAYLCCFGSLALQVIPFAGERGISPIAPQLRHMRAMLPWFRCLQLNPSLLWLASSDRGIRVFLTLGLAAAAGIVLGGAYTPLCFCVCYAVALSFQFALRLHYPWDASMLEAGFWAMFLPPALPLPQLGAAELPIPVVAFALNFLLFRIVFGFGKEKFMGFEWRDTLNTRFFLISIPSVSPVGWFVAKLPNIVHRIEFGLLAFAELLCPWLLLTSGMTHVIGVAGITAQMFAIQINSSFGFFNLLALALCLASLDPTTTLVQALSDPELLAPSRWPLALIFAVVFFGAFVYLPFNSWVSAGFLYWPAWRRLRPGPLRAFLALLRFVAPTRMLNSYGVFAAHPAPPVRWVPMVEGTRDGKTWRTYRWRYQMSDETDRPMFVAPHHPRLEGVTFYEVFGIEASGYLACLNFNNPLWFTPRSMLLDRAVQRLQEPGNPVVRLWKEDPFPEGPPTRLRVALYRFTATTLAEWRRTGRWWRKQRVGLHLPETGPDPAVWADALPPRELLASEAPRWARWNATLAGPSAEELDAFWEAFIPFVRQNALAIAQKHGRFDAAGEPWVWGNLPELALAIRQQFTREQMRTHQLTLARLTTVLSARWGAVLDRPARHFSADVLGLGSRRAPDPYALPVNASAEDQLQALAAWPRGPMRTHFHLTLAIHRLILTGGKREWERCAGGPWVPNTPIPSYVRLSTRARRSMAEAAREVRLDPQTWLESGRGLTIENGFFLEGAVNYEVVARHANRFHVLFTIGRVFEAPKHNVFPGAELLTRELGKHPELRLISGWGEEAQLSPQAELPRMTYDEQGIWREPHEKRSEFLPAESIVVD